MPLAAPSAPCSIREMGHLHAVRDTSPDGPCELEHRTRVISSFVRCCQLGTCGDSHGNDLFNTLILKLSSGSYQKKLD